MLVTTWFDDPHRPTRDLDLLGFGDSSSEAMLTVWKDICETTLEDGIKFDGDALHADPIREQLEYGGLRLRTTAALASARISITQGGPRMPLRLNSFATKARCSNGQLLFAISLRRFHHLKR